MARTWARLTNNDMMPNRKPACWSRRRVLQTGALAAVPALATGRLLAAEAAAAAPFARLTDVAAQAGLTAPMVYGDPNEVTYIVESMGGGAAFFDYDNDGWEDLFVVGYFLPHGVGDVAADAFHRGGDGYQT